MSTTRFLTGFTVAHAAVALPALVALATALERRRARHAVAPR